MYLHQGNRDSIISEISKNFKLLNICVTESSLFSRFQGMLSPRISFLNNYRHDINTSQKAYGSNILGFLCLALNMRPGDLEKKVKFKLMTYNKRSSHKASKV